MAVPRAASAADAEAEYFQAIEEFFVARRGDPLFLSNADWTLIRKWRKAGIPLRVVMRGIGDALQSHAHSWGRARKVGSLAYCANEVQTARQRWQRALAMDVPRDGEAAAFLRAYADRLDAASLGPHARAVATPLAAELRARCAGVLGDDLETWLAGCETALLRALKREASPSVLDAVAAEVDADLAPYATRLPARVLAQVRDGALARRVLGLHGLTRLSLVQLS
jgi:hypothetical protein